MSTINENMENQSSLCTFLNATVNLSDVGSTEPDCTLFSFVYFTLIIGISNILGILGNILSIAVLQKDRHNKVAVFLLQSLAIVDTLVLVISLFALSLIYALLPFIGQSELKRDIIPYLVKYIHPLGYMAQCGTIWITLLLAVNRFIAICKPFHAAKWCTLTKARIQVVIVVLVDILLNFPRFFQYDIIEIDTPHNKTIISANETAIGEHSLFGVIYTNFFYTFVVLVAPLAALTVLNLLIIKELKYSSRRESAQKQPKSTTSQTENSNLTAKKSKSTINNLIYSSKEKQPQQSRRKNSFSKPPLPEEDNITFIMVIIIVILVVCHTPDRILQIYRYFFTDGDQLKCGQTLYYVSYVCNLLIIINSSCNFIIYYVVRRRFRRILLLNICAWRSFTTYKEHPSFLENKSKAENMDNGCYEKICMDDIASK